MPNDIIQSRENLRQSWDIVDNAIRLARGEHQTAGEVWCVVSFDGVYMGTVWSRPRTQNGPTNHAEDRFFGEYSLNMISDFLDEFGRFPNVLRLSIKYSPCNKRNDDREDRCTFKIANDRHFWVSIQVRYDNQYTNRNHDMRGSQNTFRDLGVSSGRMVL